jgi:hypothetical protein
MTIEGLPAHLTEAINQLSGAARALTEEVRDDREARAVEAEQDRAEARRRGRRHTALLVGLLVIMLGLVGMAVSNRLLGNQNRAIQQQIADCTIVQDSECAQAGDRRTGAALAELQRRYRADLLAVVRCDRLAGDDDGRFERCLSEALPALPVRPPVTGPPTAPTGPPADATIAPPATDQPGHPPVTEPPSEEPPADASGGRTT